jgi:hypothetical protein
MMANEWEFAIPAFLQISLLHPSHLALSHRAIRILHRAYFPRKLAENILPEPYRA